MKGYKGYAISGPEYKYSNYLYRGKKIWKVTTPSLKRFIIINAIGRDGTFCETVVENTDGERVFVASHEKGGFRNAMKFIKDKEVS